LSRLLEGEGVSLCQGFDVPTVGFSRVPFLVSEVPLEPLRLQELLEIEDTHHPRLLG
jgi:hypothetical protein